MHHEHVQHTEPIAQYRQHVLQTSISPSSLGVLSYEAQWKYQQRWVVLASTQTNERYGKRRVPRPPKKTINGMIDLCLSAYIIICNKEPQHCMTLTQFTIVNKSKQLY